MGAVLISSHGELAVPERGPARSRAARASAERAKPAELVGPIEARPCERAGSTASGHGEGRFHFKPRRAGPFPTATAGSLFQADLERQGSRPGTAAGSRPRNGGPARGPSWSSEDDWHSPPRAVRMFLDEDFPMSKEHQRLFWPQVLTEL